MSASSAALIGICFFCISLPYAFTWFLQYVIQVVFRRWLQVEVVVKRCGYFLKFHDVTLTVPNGPSVEIACVWLSSSYWDSKLRKPICVCVTDVRVHYNTQSGSSPDAVTDRPDRHQPGSHSSTELLVRISKYSWLLSVVRRVGVTVETASCVLVSPVLPCDVLVHSNLERLQVDFGCEAAVLDCSASVDTCGFKLLQRSQTHSNEPCVVDATLSVVARASIDLESSKLSLDVAFPKPTLHVTEGVFSLITCVVEHRARSPPPAHGRSTPTPDETPNQEHALLQAPNQDASLFQESQSEPNVLLRKLLEHMACLTFCVDTVVVTLSRKTVHRAVSLCIRKIELIMSTSESEQPVVVRGMLKVTGVDATVHRKPCIGLELLQVDMKASQDEIDIDASLVDPSVNYYEKELQFWSYKIADFRQNITNQFNSNSSRSTPWAADITSESQQTPLMQQLKLAEAISFGLDVKGLKASAVLPNEDGFKAGVEHIEFSIQFTSNHEYVDHTSNLSISHVSCCSCKSPVGLNLLDSSSHYWHTILYCAHFYLKNHKVRSEYEIDARVADVQGEWSPDLATYIVQTVSTLERYRMSELSSAQRKEGAGLSTRGSHSDLLAKVFQNIQLTFMCSNINLFACNDHKVCLMVRVDKVMAEVDNMKATATLFGSNLVYCEQAGASIALHPSRKLTDSVSHVKALSIIITDLSTLEAEVKLQEEIFFNWTTGFHTCLWEAVQVGLSLHRELLAIQRPHRGASKGEEPRAPRLKVMVAAGVSVCLRLSRNHKICLSTPGINITAELTKVSLHAEACTVSLGHERIFHFQSLGLCLLQEDPRVKLERHSIDGLTLKKNRVLDISFNSLRIVFPYQFDVASYIEEVINIIKWLKLLHKKERRPFTIDSPLPPDIIIRAKEVKVQLNDDPFEGKLGDNYALMVDEMNESNRRRAAMDKKIDELRAAHRLIPAEKIDELYQSLMTRNSAIYVERARKLHENEVESSGHEDESVSSMKSPSSSSLPLHASSSVQRPPHTSAQHSAGNDSFSARELGSWRLADLEVIALADLSLHGKENAVRHMRDIDNESPYPEEGLEFTTLWGRMVSVRAKEWVMRLRDYSYPLMEIKGFNVWGRLLGAEQVAHPTAKRTCVVEVPHPWKDVVVERSMPPLKFYHDFSADVTSLDMAYGPCWEGAFAMFNLSLNLINRPSRDPSRPMPFFDKLRLLLHGRLTMCAGRMRWLYHTSLDPYNSTEFMDWTWHQLVLDWTNAKWILKGDLDIYLRTASKYDDCKLLHFPNLKFSVILDWICKGNRKDHHSVMPCAPDKLPEYSLEKHKHDSYRAFRSQNVTLSLSLETKRRPDGGGTTPTCSFYSSSLRQMEKILTCLQYVTRPTKRGRLFGNMLPRKPILSRHYKHFKVSLRLHEYDVCYWMSTAQQRGFEAHGQTLSLDSTMSLQLVSPTSEGTFYDIIRRPKADWSVKALSANLGPVNFELCSANEDMSSSSPAGDPDMLKTDFVSISKIGYRRMEPTSIGQETDCAATYVHKLEVYDVRVLWTKHNRTVSFAIFEGYSKADALKRNLSSIALKSITPEAPKTPTKMRLGGSVSVLGAANQSTLEPGATPSPATRMQTGSAFSLLQQLVEESDSNFVAYSEEETAKSGAEQLHGIVCCQKDDITKRNWLIEAHNSQVRLHGPESPGYMIISAAKAQIRSSEHEPVWHSHMLRSKMVWIFSMDCMQYYAATESRGGREGGAWLSRENIEDTESFDQNPVEEMSGSGSAVGGIVHEQIPGDPRSVELQRIISRCRCQLFYASYGEVDLTSVKEVPAPPNIADVVEKAEGVDTFTLLHHDVSCSANSLQYALIMDIVNNLLLYIEPTKKEATARLQRVRFKLQLSPEDQKTPILQLQNTVRMQTVTLRQLEKQRYLLQKTMGGARGMDSADTVSAGGLLGPGEEDTRSIGGCSITSEQKSDRRIELDGQIEEIKESLATLGEDLGILISCYNQFQIQKITQQKANKNETAVTLRRNEVCFVQAQWRLTERDGQVGLSDMVLKNFVYTKTFDNDDSGCHQLEIGSVKVLNLLPNSPYKNVLTLEDRSAQRRVAVRLISRDRPPVGGIPIKEHFEVNIVPLSIQLTMQFFNSMMQFFFQDDQAPSGTETKKKKISKRSFHGVDDIEKMKTRAENNNMFIYIRVPEVPLRVSYKGLKDKNFITDLNDVVFQLPTLEYHNKTWRWKDLVVQIKTDLKKVVVSQAIKQKLHMKSKFYVGDDSYSLADSTHDEEKARMLLGNRGSVERSSQRRGLFGRSKVKK